MNGTTTLVFATGALVLINKWTNKKEFGVRTAIGLGFYAVMISMVDNANHEIAVRIAGLILLVAFLENGPAILKGLGLTQ